MSKCLAHGGGLHLAAPKDMGRTSPRSHHAPGRHRSAFVPLSTASSSSSSRHICASTSSSSSSSRLLVYLVPLSFVWQVQKPCTKSQFQRFRQVLWAVQIRFHSHPFTYSPVYIVRVSPISPCFLALAFPFFLSFLLPLSCTSQTSLQTSHHLFLVSS